MQDEQQIIERQLVEMLTLAGEYCIMMEKLDQVETKELYSFLQKISPILYMRGLLFPETPEPDEEGNERFVTEEQWEKVFNDLRSLFAESDQFRFLDPDAEDTETNSLAELFADIYQDLKDFVWLMTKNTLLSRTFATYNIKRYFSASWGYKLLKVQLVMHYRFIKADEAEGYHNWDLE